MWGYTYKCLVSLSFSNHLSQLLLAPLSLSSHFFNLETFKLKWLYHLRGIKISVVSGDLGYFTAENFCLFSLNSKTIQEVPKSTG